MSLTLEEYWVKEELEKHIKTSLEPSFQLCMYQLILEKYPEIESREQIEKNIRRLSLSHPLINNKTKEKCVSICCRDISPEICAEYEEYVKKEEQYVAYKKMAEKIILSTTHIIQGKNIDEYLGLITSEVVIGTGFFAEWDVSYADMFGTTSIKFQEKLKKAKLIGEQLIKEEAVSRGANAIIGMDIDYNTFENNIIALVLSGTAVRLS